MFGLLKIKDYLPPLKKIFTRCNKENNFQIARKLNISAKEKEFNLKSLVLSDGVF